MLELVLGAGGLEVRAPQLVGDEQQQHHAGGDQEPSDRSEDTARGEATGRGGSRSWLRRRLGGRSHAAQGRGRPTTIRGHVPGPAGAAAERPVRSVGPMEPAVHLRGAVSLIGRFPALAGVDLDVDWSEVVLLQGPNGAGKTTILRCCAGLVPVSAGEARVLGIDLTRRIAARYAAGSVCSATPPGCTTS